MFKNVSSSRIPLWEHLPLFLMCVCIKRRDVSSLALGPLFRLAVAFVFLSSCQTTPTVFSSHQHPIPSSQTPPSSAPTVFRSPAHSHILSIFSRPWKHWVIAGRHMKAAVIGLRVSIFFSNGLPEAKKADDKKYRRKMATREHAFLKLKKFKSKGKFMSRVCNIHVALENLVVEIYLF